MMLKVRNEKGYALRGVLGVSCTKNGYIAKGVGELLDQCSQCNYITGLKQGYPNASYHLVNPNYTNVVSLVDSEWSLTQVLESKYYRYSHKH